MRESAPDVDTYITQFPHEVQSRLQAVRHLIFNTVPDAVESISYGMPAYKFNKKVLVYFAAYERHLGFYATPEGQAHFAIELAGYKQGRGSVQFPHNKPLTLDLMKAIIEFKLHLLLLKTKKA